jgi:hypothetical protein
MTSTRNSWLICDASIPQSVVDLYKPSVLITVSYVSVISPRTLEMPVNSKQIRVGPGSSLLITGRIILAKSASLGKLVNNY